MNLVGQRTSAVAVIATIYGDGTIELDLDSRATAEAYGSQVFCGQVPLQPLLWK